MWFPKTYDIIKQLWEKNTYTNNIMVSFNKKIKKM
jgi:hypothetical protein